MALNKLKYNSFNVTPAASEAIRFNSGADGFETATAGGSLVKISSTTASSSASISFTSGLTSTYKEYIFIFNNIHPATNNVNFQFNLSIDSGSNYNVTKTSTSFGNDHKEDDGYAFIGYGTGSDLAQSTSDQILTWGGTTLGNENDESMSGYIHLFDPSNTTFVKHFISVSQMNSQDDYSHQTFTNGYGNTTSAINAIQFKMSSGNIDAGTIAMYGVS